MDEDTPDDTAGKTPPCGRGKEQHDHQPMDLKLSGDADDEKVDGADDKNDEGG